MSKKMFFGGVALLLGFAVMFGFVLPWLMSAKSTIAAVIAVSIILMLGVIATHFALDRVCAKNGEDNEG